MHTCVDSSVLGYSLPVQFDKIISFLFHIGQQLLPSPPPPPFLPSQQTINHLPARIVRPLLHETWHYHRCPSVWGVRRGKRERYRDMLFGADMNYGTWMPRPRQADDESGNGGRYVRPHLYRGGDREMLEMAPGKNGRSVRGGRRPTGLRRNVASEGGRGMRRTMST